MSEHISINVRFLLWRRGVPRAEWASWLVNHTSIEPHIVKSLITGGLADGNVGDECLRKIGNALELGDEADNLRYQAFALGGCNILQENLRHLFDSLGRGGKKCLAADLSVDPTTVSRWLNGSYEPHSSTLQQLASYFGLPAGTELSEQPIFLSIEPVAMTERRSWLHRRLDSMSMNELRELYPALRRLLEER